MKVFCHQPRPAIWEDNHTELAAWLSFRWVRCDQLGLSGNQYRRLSNGRLFCQSLHPFIKESLIHSEKQGARRCFRMHRVRGTGVSLMSHRAALPWRKNCISHLRNKKHRNNRCFLAERGGFEPPNEYYPINHLAGGPVQPLRHLPEHCYYKRFFKNSSDLIKNWYRQNVTAQWFAKSSAQLGGCLLRICHMWNITTKI